MLAATGDPLNDALVFLLVNWPITLAVAFGAAGIYWLLPRPRPTRQNLGYALALAGLAVGTIAFLPNLGVASRVTPESVLFYSFSTLAIASAGLMVVQRNAARAAICFAVTVLSVCGLFLLLAAPFLMAATIITYAGAIIVTFLFVVMLAQQAGYNDADDRSREPGLGVVSAFFLLGLLLLTLQRTYTTPGLDRLLARASAAADTERPDEAVDVLRLSTADKDGKRYFDALEAELDRLRGQPEAYRVLRPLADEAQASWENRERKFDKAKADLQQLAAAGPRVKAALGTQRPGGVERMSEYGGTPANAPPEAVQRDAEGRAKVPAANVAALGRALFTDYLLAVELGGTVLLVATVGALAISARRPETTTS